MKVPTILTKAVLPMAAVLHLAGCGALGDDANRSSRRALAHVAVQAGQIVDVRRNATISRDVLLQDLATADFVLIGEVHDNADQHRIQAELLRALSMLTALRSKRTALAMEQFDREHQPAIDEALQRASVATGTTVTTDTIADAGRFNRTGWNWLLYEPIVAVALEARMPIVAANLSRERARDVARQGFAALGANVAADLALDGNWTPVQQAILTREIDDGHCGKLPASAMPRMVDIQRARDANMADAIVERAPDGAVVIAGNGHVRNDVGVPIHLARRVPQKRVVSVGLLEIDPASNDAGAAAASTKALPPFDYVWYTNAARRDDPCEGLVMPSRQQVRVAATRIQSAGHPPSSGSTARSVVSNGANTTRMNDAAAGCNSVSTGAPE